MKVPLRGGIPPSSSTRIIARPLGSASTRSKLASPRQTLGFVPWTVYRTATRHASTARPKQHPSARLSSTMNPAVAETSPLLSTTELEPPSPPPPPAPGSVPSIQLVSTSTLLRSYLVYTFCSLPLLIDHSPRLLHAFTHSPIPGLKALTEWGVRHTFFEQFVPGETVEECVKTMRELRGRGVGSVLNYSAEVEEELAASSAVRAATATLGESTGGPGGTDGHLGPLSRGSSAESGAGQRDMAKMLEKQRLDEVFKALRVSGEYELDIEKNGEARGSTGFALKITGLIDPMILQRASTTLLRLRHAEKTDRGGVPYPGTPVSGDGRVVASSPGSVDQSMFDLKGTVPKMGVLESDEGVRPADLEEMNALWKNLCAMCEEAKTHGIKLMVDAEHTWYQPALDAYTLLLSEKYNRPPKDGNWTGPLIYGTYQSYLLRQKSHLPAALQHAKDNGYALGLKVVRGAYFMQERKKWKEEGRSGADPIWTDKHATDVSYNSAVNTIISSLSSQLGSDRSHASSVVFGTHNPQSVDLIIQNLKSSGMAKAVDGGKLRLREDVKGRIGVAQLYGMKDDLMDKVVATFEPSNQPVSLKYIAYGKLDEVIPFLGRRAIENKSLMSGEGGAAAERRRIWAELARRYFGHGEAATA